MSEILLVIGLVVALFVGFNIGGATTGPAFGPAVGAKVISKVAAAGLMSVFFFVGALTIGRRVVETLGTDIVGGADVFTLQTATVVLLFIGIALFIGNYFGVPASTSMTAVGAIAALGVSTGEINWEVMTEILIWWIVAPIIGFWVSGVIGRYFYPALNRWVAIQQSDGPLVTVDRSGTIPRIERGPGTSSKELYGASVVILIGCLMAFSSGTSNIANAIAPLYGADIGGLGMNTLIVLGSIAVMVGAFTIARRTLDTLGNDITDLPLTAAIVVATVSSGLVVGLSAIGIPASFVIIATMSIIGLGWGRATRSATVPETVRGETDTQVSVGALAAEEPGEEIPDIGEEDPDDLPNRGELFDPSTTARVIVMQNVVPIISTVGAYLTFQYAPIVGL